MSFANVLESIQIIRVERVIKRRIALMSLYFYIRKGSYWLLS